MNLVALGLYGVAGLGGLILILRLFKGQDSPMMMAILHMGFAVAGAVTLASFIFSGDRDPLFTTALIVYAAAALGGLFLFSYRFRDAGMPPKAIAGVHALAAVAGTGLLAFASFG